MERKRRCPGGGRPIEPYRALLGAIFGWLECRECGTEYHVNFRWGAGVWALPVHHPGER